MILLRHVYKTYAGPVHALRDIDLQIDKGEFLYLTGHSGAGKTTLFRLISAFDRPTSGSVSVAGYRVESLSESDIPRLRRRIGVVYQDYKLLKHFSVFENVRLPLDVVGTVSTSVVARVEEVLEQVGLLSKKNTYPDQLSGGEQQRVAIARAIVHRPELLIADEPTGNLDQSKAEEIMSLLEKVNAQGTTVFVATHNLDLVHRGKRRRVHLERGQFQGEIH